MIIPLQLLNVLDEQDGNLIEQLYDKYIGLMYREAFKFHSMKADAEELIQKSWFKLIEHFDRFKQLHETKQASYILAIVRNTAIDDSRRSKHRYICFSDLTPEMIDSLPSDDLVEQGIIYNITIEELANAIDNLPSNYKYLLMAKYHFEKSDEEIAKYLGINPDHVRIYLMRARRKAITSLEGMSDEL